MLSNMFGRSSFYNSKFMFIIILLVLDFQQKAVAMSSLESRLRGALWGLFSGDALAAPTHWYYGGSAQIKSDYGINGIQDYTKPKFNLVGSILNKSSTNGGGRGSFHKKTKDDISIVGDVINHGKRQYWDPKLSIHYHATLQKGENTLEAQLARVLMKSIVANKGNVDLDHFRKAYISFMTTPNSHNDTYVSTCHRMFFANLILKKKSPEECPDNDQHNVDTVDGLVLPSIASLAVAARLESKTGSITGAALDELKQKARDVAASTASVTRKSSVLERFSGAWSDVVFDSLHSQTDYDISTSVQKVAKDLGLPLPQDNGPDEMSACYLQGSFPPTLNMVSKYTTRRDNDAWTGLIANANIGGENVHRGAILGVILGARAGLNNLPSQMRNGLHDYVKLEKEIDDFVKAVIGRDEEL